MKKKLTILGLMALLATSVGTGTLAYYTSVGRAHNVITSGGIGIEIIEKTRKNDGTEVDFPKDGIGSVMPGTEISKIVSVKNTGDNTAWIRVEVEQSIKNSASDALPLTLEIPALAAGETRSVPVMNIFINDSKWMKEGEYYYYKEPVQSGESTDILFEEVKFAKEMGNEYQSCKANIIVTAEAVQSDNNPIPEGGDVTDVKGWPESRGGE